MGKTYRQLSLQERRTIHKMLREGDSIDAIAETLQIHIATVYREIQRGKRDGSSFYDPEYADEQYNQNKSKRTKPMPMLLKDKQTAEKLSSLLQSGKYSVSEAITELKKLGYENIPTKSTVYSSIDKGLIPNVTRETLKSNETTVFGGGQIRIPKWICEQINLKDGEIIIIENNDKEEIIIKRKKE